MEMGIYIMIAKLPKMQNNPFFGLFHVTLNLFSTIMLMDLDSHPHFAYVFDLL